MDWRDRVPACFGDEDLIFASDPMDEERAEKAINEAKAAGASRDDFEKEMVWEGWYEQRQFVQLVFIALVAMTCLIAAITLLLWARNNPIPTKLALIGTTMVLG